MIPAALGLIAIIAMIAASILAGTSKHRAAGGVALAVVAVLWSILIAIAAVQGS